MHTVIQGDFPHLYDKIAETCHQAKVLEQIFVRYDIIQFFIKQNEVHYPKFGANHVLYVVYSKGARFTRLPYYYHFFYIAELKRYYRSCRKYHFHWSYTYLVSRLKVNFENNNTDQSENYTLYSTKQKEFWRNIQSKLNTKNTLDQIPHTWKRAVQGKYAVNCSQLSNRITSFPNQLVHDTRGV